MPDPKYDEFDEVQQAELSKEKKQDSSRPLVHHKRTKKRKHHKKKRTSHKNKEKEDDVGNAVEGTAALVAVGVGGGAVAAELARRQNTQ